MLTKYDLKMPHVVFSGENALDKITEVDLVIDFTVDRETVMKRLTGRRSCSCGGTFHISKLDSEYCPVCGKKLYIRDDDKPDVIE